MMSRALRDYVVIGAKIQAVSIVLGLLQDVEDQVFQQW